MEISKKDIYCEGITKRIERLSTSIRKFIQLVNRNIPEEFHLGNECFFIDRKDDAYNFLDDGNTICPGFSYKVYWAYTLGKVNSSNKMVASLKQNNTVTFLLDCGERCYDHRENSLYFLSLYFKEDNSNNKAVRLNCINDNYNENHIFRPYELMQVVWRIKEALNLLPNNITENDEEFEKFAKSLEEEKFVFRPDVRFKKFEIQLPIEISGDVEKFKQSLHRFVCVVNYYVAVASKKLEVCDFEKYRKGGKITPTFQEAIEKFIFKPIESTKRQEVMPKTFIWIQDSHDTLDQNERLNTFQLYNCLKVIFGYSYFNDYVFYEGIYDNWHPRLLYFSYYTSSDFQKTYYTISMTSCEERFNSDGIKVIEASTIDELLSTKNAIKIGKWLEEIWEKTALINYYTSQIENEKNFDFLTTNKID